MARSRQPVMHFSRITSLVILTTLALAGVGLAWHPGHGLPWTLYFDDWLLSIVEFSVWQAFLSAVLSVAIAIPFAFAFALQPFRGQWLLKGLLNLFFIMPVLTIIMAVVAAYSPVMNVFSLKGILLAHFYLNVPYAIRMIWQRLGSVSQTHLRLAQTLDFSWLNRLRWLYVPLLLDAVKPTLVIIFLLCFSSFTVVLTLGGGPANTNLEVAIFQALKFEFDPRAAVLYSAIHTLIALVFIWMLGRREVFNMEQGEPPARTALPGKRQSAAILLLLVVLLYPLLSLVLDAFSQSWRIPTRLPEALLTSVLLGLGSSVLALALALFRAQDERQSRLLRFLDFGLMLLPVMVIATGLFLFALRMGVAFKVTFALIILLNALMAMPLIVTPLSSRIRAYRQRYSLLAQTLGMSGALQWRLIYWPAVRSLIPWTLTLAFVLSVGDLGIAALVGSVEFVTLPVLIYQAMGSYQMVLASQLTLLLLLVCGGLLVLAEWKSERKHHAPS